MAKRLTKAEIREIIENYNGEYEPEIYVCIYRYGEPIKFYDEDDAMKWLYRNEDKFDSIDEISEVIFGDEEDEELAVIENLDYLLDEAIENLRDWEEEAKDLERWYWSTRL